MEFSLIVLSFNNVKATKLCIESILPYLSADRELHIIDDGSTDGTTAYLSTLSEKHTNIHVHCNTQNKGAAYSRNIGIKRSKGKNLLFLDNDIRFEGDVCTHMRNVAIQHQAGIVGLCGIVVNDNFREYIHIHHAQIPLPTPVSAVPSYCMLVTKENTDKFNLLFDERLDPFAGEDVEYCIHAKSLGIKVIAASHVPLSHSEHGSGLVHDHRYLEWMNSHHMLIKEWWETRYIASLDSDLKTALNLIKTGNIKLALKTTDITFYDFVLGDEILS